MGVNHVNLSSGESLFDLRGDTVTPETLLKGIKAHNRAGEPITGIYENTIPEGYIKPSGNINIIANGTHDVKAFEKAVVNVPIPDGYILPTDSKTITSNGEHDVSAFAKALVNVSGQYYESSLKPDANTHTASFSVGFEPGLFIVVAVQGTTNSSTSTYYVTTLWHAKKVASVGAWTGGLGLYKSGSNSAVVSYNANSYYTYSNGVVSINDTAHYFKSGLLYRVIAMA